MVEIYTQKNNIKLKFLTFRNVNFDKALTSGNVGKWQYRHYNLKAAIMINFIKFMFARKSLMSTSSNIKSGYSSGRNDGSSRGEWSKT